MDQIIINRSTLNPHIRNLNTSDIILLLNSIPAVRTEIQNKGLRAEENIAECIKGFEVDYHGKKHCGDIVIWKKNYPSIKIMLEVKNYTSTIPTEQYEKFIYDMELNKFDGGIFISNYPIAGYGEFWLKDNICGIVSYDPAIINMVAEMLWAKLNNCIYSINICDELNELQQNINLLAEIKTAVINLQKSTKKQCGKLLNTADRIMDSTGRIIKKINKSIELPTQRHQLNGDFILIPSTKMFYSKHLPVKSAIENIINKLSGDVEASERLVCIIAGNVRVEFAFWTTKIEISITPVEFTDVIKAGFCDFSFNSGKFKITINADNKNSDVFDKLNMLLFCKITKKEFIN